MYFYIFLNKTNKLTCIAMKNILRISSLLISIIFIIGGFNACTVINPVGISFSSISDMGYESSGTQTVTILMDKSIGSDVTIEFEFSGTAIKSSDYNFFSTEVTIPAGSTSADISFSIINNYEYEPTDKTIIVNLTTISGPGVDEVEFGENTTYTFTLQEDDVEIDLAWTSTTGITDDFDLDLALIDASENYIDWSYYGDGLETVQLDGGSSNGTYYAVAQLWSGPTSTETANYTMTVRLPDGSTQTHSDMFTSERTTDRTLWGITKTGSTYTVTQDPFGSNGKAAIEITRIN